MSATCREKSAPKILFAITQQISWDAIEGKGLAQLLSHPFRCRMGGHIAVDHATSFMHQKHVQHLGRMAGTVKKSTETRVLTNASAERQSRQTHYATTQNGRRTVRDTNG